jgi:acyl carrier protein
VAAVLGERAADGIRPRQRLFDLGIDSLMAVELKNRLQSAFGIPLGATLVFDHPTVEALTDHLLEEWSVLNGPAPSSGGKSSRKRSDAGMAPGEETRGEEPDIGACPGETDLDEASPEDVARMLAKELEAESET